MPDPVDPRDAFLADAVFRKSRRSDNSGSCVEVATNLAPDHDAILMRDTKDRTGDVLFFDRYQWYAFLHGVQDGEFDL